MYSAQHVLLHIAAENKGRNIKYSAPHNSNGSFVQAVRRKSNPISRFYNIMRKGIRAAGAIHAFPFKKEAILRTVS